MKKMWGGVFNEKIADSVLQYTNSINIDKNLSKFDIKYSIVHAMALEKADLISNEELKRIVESLEEINCEIKNNGLEIFSDVDAEDIHSFIEESLYSKIGDVAYKLHAGRSRNDQVMVSTRLYCKENVDLIIDKLNKFIKAILQVADANKKVIIPGYTHLQHAQPVLFSHHLLAYINMLKRDKKRFYEIKKQLDVLSSGSAACSGTSINLNLSFIAEKLGFAKVSENSLDAVSDRDFVIDILSGLSILFMHLSRLSEDLILWYSKEFGIISIDDSFCTGSSIMPHKKNPDVLELIRGNTSKIYGDLISALTLLKGLPLSYNRDLQLDKGFLFNGINISLQTLDIISPIIKAVKINKNRAKELLEDEGLYITDIAEWLTKKGMPFREAHIMVGRIYKYCIKKKIKFSELSLKKLKEFSVLFDKDVFKLFKASRSVKNKVTYNSTNPNMVSDKISKLLKEFE